MLAHHCSPHGSRRAVTVNSRRGSGLAGLEPGALERHGQDHAEVDPVAPAAAHAAAGAEHAARIGRGGGVVDPGLGEIDEHERLERERVGVAREQAAVAQLERGADGPVAERDRPDRSRGRSCSCRG